MTKKTRYFVLVSGAILAAGLTTGIVASLLGLPVTLFSSAAGPSELEYVPANAAVVAYADVRNVMNSEFRQRVRQFEPEGRGRNDFQERTGVDIEHDIDTVVAAMLPQGAGRPGADSALVLARGRFDVVRLEGLAREHGGQVEDYQGTRLVRHSERGGDAPEMALGFIEPGLVAIGSYAAVRQSIDTKREGHNVMSNTELMRLVADLGTNNAWAVGRFDALTSRTNLPGELLSQVPAITWFSAAGLVNGGLSGLFKAEARDEESARNIRDMLRGFVALARLQSDGRPELNSMIESLQLGGDGRTVAISFTLPTEVFEALGALANIQREGAAGVRDAQEAQREAARKLREAADKLERLQPPPR